MEKYKKILAIGAHPDDIECGCAGSIAKWIDQGADVYFVTMSRRDNRFKDAKEGSSNESKRATNTLGVKSKFMEIYDLPDKELPEHRREIMDILEVKQKEIKPDLVLIPFINDPHQDHEAVAKAAIRTFRRNETILQYEILRHGSHSFTPNLFIDITRYINKKLDALDCYVSQTSKRAYFNRDYFKALAGTRGAQSGYAYAEGFLIYKMFW